jgi:hypothetical protein
MSWIPTTVPIGKSSSMNYALVVAMLMEALTQGSCAPDVVNFTIRIASGHHRAEQEMTRRKKALATAVLAISLAACGSAQERALDEAEERVDEEVEEIVEGGGPHEGIPYRSSPQTQGGLTLEITGLGVSDETSRVYVRAENRNSYPIQCSYAATVVIEGHQYQPGFSLLGEIQADASLESYYEWDSILPAAEEFTLHSYCFDESREVPMELTFELTATKESKP